MTIPAKRFASFRTWQLTWEVLTEDEKNQKCQLAMLYWKRNCEAYPYLSQIAKVYLALMLSASSVPFETESIVLSCWFGEKLASLISCAASSQSSLFRARQPGVKLGGSRGISAPPPLIWDTWDPLPLMWDPPPPVLDPLPHWHRDPWDPAPRSTIFTITQKV